MSRAVIRWAGVKLLRISEMLLNIGIPVYCYLSPDLRAQKKAPNMELSLIIILDSFKS
jgi:hypothetical protein